MHAKQTIPFVTGLCTLLAAHLCAAAPNPPPITISFKELSPGKIFQCTISTHVRYKGGVPLKRFYAVARAFSGTKILASAGFRIGGRPLVKEALPEIKAYSTVPLEFAFRGETCKSMDSVGIVFARCTFGSGPSSDCLDRVRVTGPAHSRITYFVQKVPPH